MPDSVCSACAHSEIMAPMQKPRTSTAGWQPPVFAQPRVTKPRWAVDIYGLWKHILWHQHRENKQEGRLSANGTNRSRSRNVLEQGTCAHTGCWENTACVNSSHSFWPRGSQQGWRSVCSQATVKICPVPQRQARSTDVTERKTASSPDDCWTLWSYLRSLPGTTQTPQQVCCLGSVIFKKPNHCNSLSRQNNF